MNKMPWFRVYSEAIHDRKLRRVARQTSQPWPLVFGAWVGMLCLANESPQRGRILIGEDMPMEHDEIAEELQLDMSTYRTLWRAFEEAGMVADNGNGVTICKWEERQFKSDNSTERVRRHRRKKAKRDSNKQAQQGETLQERSDETFQNRYRSDTEQIRTDQSNARAGGPNGEVAGPNQDNAYTAMLAAVSSVVKTTYAEHVNGQQFDDVVYTFIGYDYTPEQVKGFAEWWTANGWHQGPPALKTLLNDFKQYLQDTHARPDGPIPRIRRALEEHGANLEQWPADLQELAAPFDWSDPKFALASLSGQLTRSRA